MKRLVMLIAAVVVAVPLAAFGDEPKKTADAPKTTADAAKTTGSQPQVVSAVVAPTADSPLVAAAKRTKRSGKKVVVITNDSLSNEAMSKAHITTTTNMRAVVVPSPSAEILQEETDARIAKATKAAQEQKDANKAKRDAAIEKKIRETHAQHEDEGPYGDDPAAIEHRMEELSKQNKEPPPEKPPA
jgi:hypothetical protein